MFIVVERTIEGRRLIATLDTTHETAVETVNDPSIGNLYRQEFPRHYLGRDQSADQLEDYARCMRETVMGEPLALDELFYVQERTQDRWHTEYERYQQEADREALKLLKPHQRPRYRLPRNRRTP